MKLIILSDIHANLTALKAVLKDIQMRKLENIKFVLLGDTINYGLRPNETINILKGLDTEVAIAGNHEMALLGVQDDRFSSPRGREILEVTKSIISKENIVYIDENFSKDYVTKAIDGKQFLFIHGALDDKYWGTINLNNMQDERYKKYDVVISGHSHKPHFVEIFFEDNNPEKRNKKRTVFINPGSVGQPRNHSSESQYAIVDTKTLEVTFAKVKYDVVSEQKVFDKYQVDSFYKIRLGDGV